MSPNQEKLRQLRERTGQPVVECQRALEEAEGDVDRAIALMRLRGETYTVDAKERFNALIEGFKKGRGEADE